MIKLAKEVHRTPTTSIRSGKSHSVSPNALSIDYTFILFRWQLKQLGFVMEVITLITRITKHNNVR